MKDFLSNCKNIYQTQGENALYYVDADAFLREGEECVTVLPLCDNSGVIGIVLEHSYWNEEDGIYETYQEMFEFPDEEVERLDYSVTVPSINGLETARFFVEHPVYGTVGYPTYEDACEDMHGILGFGQFLDTVESMIQAGFIGDSYIFNSQNMLIEIRSNCEYWTWTPETGIVYDPEPEPEYPNRKQRRAVRIERNKQKKGSDRAHGKKRLMSRKDRMRANDEFAQMTRPIGMWRTNCKGESVFRPFQRTNRHNNYVSPEQDRLNALNVLGKNVSVADIRWAKDVCVRTAYNNKYECGIFVDLSWLLANAETLEREIALVTVIKESWWHNEFEGIEICLPTTKDCFASIEAKEYLPLCKKYDIGLVIEKYNPYR